MKFHKSIGPMLRNGELNEETEGVLTDTYCDIFL